MNVRCIDKANRRSGFTLVELLVVVAIIGFLAGITVPVVGSVRKKARTVQCISNLRSLHLAMSLYANDGNYWPSVNLNSSASPATQGTDIWFVAIVRLGYLETKKQDVDGKPSAFAAAMGCPANERLVSTPYTYTSQPYPLRPNYAMNVYWGEGTVANRRISRAAVSNPRAILLVDTYNTYSSLYATDPRHLAWNSTGCEIPRDLHGAGSNAVQADGAVLHISPAGQPAIEDAHYWDPTL